MKAMRVEASVSSGLGKNDLTKIDCYKSANTEAQDTTPGKYRIGKRPKMKAL